MEIKAIIGRDFRKGKGTMGFLMSFFDSGKIGDYNVLSILFYLGRLNTKPLENNGYETNEDFVSSFNPRTTTPYGKGKNLYIHVSNLKDPQNFFNYLSSRGFTLRDSKIFDN